MDFGAHLPLIAFGGGAPTLPGLRAYAARAAELGYRFLCANDHLLFTRPWLDGPTALAATIDASADMTLATTVALPVVRGPATTAKAAAALDLLSGGRLVLGVGPGSSARDYALAGVPFEQRWKRFDESVRALRSLLGPGHEPFEGEFYSTRDVVLEPLPAKRPPIWIASWGSEAGLRRVARLGDGWLASAYNTTPERFRESAALLSGRRGELPNALATTWLHVTDRRRDAERLVGDVLAPLLGRSAEEVESLALPIGSAELCAERMSAYAEAGVQRVFVWPIEDEFRQLELFRDAVAR